MFFGILAIRNFKIVSKRGGDGGVRGQDKKMRCCINRYK